MMLDSVRSDAEAVLDRLADLQPVERDHEAEMLALFERRLWAAPVRPAPPRPTLPHVSLELARLGYQLRDRGSCRLPRWELIDRAGNVVNALCYPDCALSWAMRAHARALGDS